jgi:predicted AAA+ superfamily ATPase
MTRWFTTTGPCNPAKYYTLSPTERLPQLERLIAQESYFVLHAPRQTGKTTAMLALAQELTKSGRYTAILLSLEGVHPSQIRLGQFPAENFMQLLCPFD